MSQYDDHYDHHNQFAEPSFVQMANMTTKGLIIAKVAGADVSWRQAFAPMIFVIKLAILVPIGLFMLCVLFIVAVQTFYNPDPSVLADYQRRQDPYEMARERDRETARVNALRQRQVNLDRMPHQYTIEQYKGR